MVSVQENSLAIEASKTTLKTFGIWSLAKLSRTLFKKKIKESKMKDLMMKEKARLSLMTQQSDDIFSILLFI